MKNIVPLKQYPEKDPNPIVYELYQHYSVYVDGSSQVNCETDFVARNERFCQLVHEAATTALLVVSGGSRGKQPIS